MGKKLVYVFKKLPGDKIMVAESSRSLSWRSVMSACKKCQVFREICRKVVTQNRIFLHMLIRPNLIQQEDFRFGNSVVLKVKVAKVRSVKEKAKVE